MGANTKPIFPLTPWNNTASLAAVTACDTRGPIATANLAAKNLVLLSDVSANGRRIDRIQVQACSTNITAATVAGIVGIWQWDGTNANLIDEIVVSAPAQTPSTTSPAFVTCKSYDYKVLPAGHKLYVSTSVTTTAAANALAVTADGGDY